MAVGWREGNDAFMSSSATGLIFITIAGMILALSSYKIRGRKSLWAIFFTLSGFLASLVLFAWGAFLLIVRMNSN
jgi:hypothetical protein